MKSLSYRRYVMSNTAIFIDYDNIYITLEKYYQTKKSQDDLKSKIIKEIKQYFTNDNIITFKAFADFQKVNATLTILQKNQVELRHVYSSSDRKNASDIAMTISIMKSIYSNDSIDKYVIISSDSDILQVINEIKYFCKDVFVIYSEYGSKDAYNEYLDKNKYETIEKLLSMPVYVPIAINTISINTNDYLNIINSGIRKIFNEYKHKGGGTASKKDISDLLYDDTSLNLVLNDAILIIDYLLSSKILIESPSHLNSKYMKVLINKDYILTNKINLNADIINESDYKTK